MPEESAILAHAPDLAPLIIAHALKGVVGGPENESVVRRSFQIAEAAALVSLCEETLWSDYGLLPALRDDFIGDELGRLGNKVLRPDGRAVRDIRECASRELATIRKPGASPAGFPAFSEAPIDHAEDNFARSVNTGYLKALTQWVAPLALPDPLKQSVLAGWYPRFCAALRNELAQHGQFTEVIGGADLTDEERRFAELNRQSWRLDEVLEKVDKWAQLNPGGVRGATISSAGHSGSRDQGPWRVRRWMLIGTAVLVGALLLGAVFRIALGTSPAVESLMARVQVNRLNGVSERVARAAAWMGNEPVPRDIFITQDSDLQVAADRADRIKPEQVDAALVDLQQKSLCHAVADGWIFAPQLSDKYRVANASGSEWWERALRMLRANVPRSADDESIESVKRWRLVIPHLLALIESAPDDVLAGEQMQTLVASLSKGLLTTRVEPGRRPVLWDFPESDFLQKRINGFLETPGKYFETEFKGIEQKHGRFSDAMVTVHRYLAEIAWRQRELKEEQNSWIRAARVLEKQEPRDADQIAFCYQRLGISRAIAGDLVGAEEAFAEALKIAREHHGEANPAAGRMERKVARVFTDLGAFDPGWKHHQQALEALMKAYPVATPEIAELHEEQAELLIDYRQFAKGIELLKRGIEVWKQIEYATSPNIARTHGRLADAQMLAGELAEAERSARSQRDLVLREYGNSSLEVRNADVALSQILLTTGDPAKAAEAGKLMEPYAVGALDRKLPDNAETALARCVYARALAQTNRVTDAIGQFDRGIRILLNTQPRPGLLVAGCLRDYGQALLETDRKLDGLKALDDAEAELGALSRMRPRYLRVATGQIDAIRERIQKARQ
jgi:tetratricopeptide (TPR) repeat protein